MTNFFENWKTYYTEIISGKQISHFAERFSIIVIVMFCLIVFAAIFMAMNNPIGLGEEAATQLESTGGNLSSAIFLVPEDVDALLNISADTDPTEGFLGSRDSVATTYGIMDMAHVFFTSSKTLISWVFGGEIGKMLLAIFGGLFGLVSLYWITKWIRNGL